jgi:hypothetical protein
MGDARSLGDEREEASHPVGVAAFRSIGAVSAPDPLSQEFERREGIGTAFFVHDGTGRAPMPVRSVEEVDEVDAQGVFGLAYLPVLPSTLALQALAECTYLVGEGFVRGGACEESAYPADAVGGRLSFTSCDFRRNSPNCCRDASSSRINHLGGEVSNARAVRPWSGEIVLW